MIYQSCRNTLVAKMESAILGMILFSVCFLTTSAVPIVPEQVGCAEGEPLVGKFTKKSRTLIVVSLLAYQFSFKFNTRAFQCSLK
jgi:hypothetical protein